MRLFNSWLLLWGVFGLIIPRISSIPVPEDLQVDPVDDEKTLVPREYSLDDSPHEHSLDTRDSSKPRAPLRFYTLGDQVSKSRKKYVLYSKGGEVYASVRLVGLLGEGAQGSVWEGKFEYHSSHKKSDRVAVKLSPSGEGIDQGILQEQVESEFVFKFKALVWSQNTGESVQIMHFFRTNLLKALTRGEEVNVARAIEYPGRAALAAGKKGIVHRDIKPDNIFIDWDGMFYLGDWDLAKQLPRKDDYFQTRAGAPIYNGPEAANKEEHDALKNSVFQLALSWLEAEAPRKMILHREFRLEVYKWLTVPGDKKVRPGRSYDATLKYLEGKFTSLSLRKLALMAKGLCFESQRFSLPDFMLEFHEVNKRELMQPC